MKAVIIKAPGGLDRVECTELPDPGPPGPGMVRVRLHASSLNFHDYAVVSTPNRVADRRIPMSDGAGLIEAVGEGVTEFEVGDHVVSCFFPTWTEGAPAIGDFPQSPVMALMDMRARSSSHRRLRLPARLKGIRSPKLRRSLPPA